MMMIGIKTTLARPSKIFFNGLVVKVDIFKADAKIALCRQKNELSFKVDVELCCRTLKSTKSAVFNVDIKTEVIFCRHKGQSSMSA